VAVIESELGQITLDSEPGACLGAARAAIWRSADAQTVIPGCWRPIDGGVQLVFLDGDALRVPLRALKKPTGA
jgi:hypothetical protein